MYTPKTSQLNPYRLPRRLLASIPEETGTGDFRRTRSLSSLSSLSSLTASFSSSGGARALVAARPATPVPPDGTGLFDRNAVAPYGGSFDRGSTMDRNGLGEFTVPLAELPIYSFSTGELETEPDDKVRRRTRRHSMPELGQVRPPATRPSTPPSSRHGSSNYDE